MSPTVGQPDEFLRELVAWGQSAPDEIFIARPGHETYADVADELGPYPAEGTYRRAVMLEVLRVLGGFESSWEWNAGVDPTNPDSNTPCTEEAGAFQCSGNSMNFDPSLKTLVRQVAGSEDCNSTGDHVEPLVRYRVLRPLTSLHDSASWTHQASQDS